MAARLLAYGGTSFSERRRIGQWPAIPEATLRDSYALQPASWCYGMGVLASRPFLILRQRQNIENRGGYPFSLLLDPGDPVWELFDWNGAALIAALLQSAPDLLLRTPESCSADALDALLSRLAPGPCTELHGTLPSLLAAAAAVSEPIVASPASLQFSERPAPVAAAGAFAVLPVCFRASTGWLIGGGSAHGRALGANFVLDDQSQADPQPYVQAGQTLLLAWESARRRALVTALDSKPMWTWEQNPGEIFEAVLLLRDLETTAAITGDLLARTAGVRAFKDAIEQVTADLLVRGTAPLGSQASALLIAMCLQSRRKLDAAAAARLDPGTVLTELRRWGSPPRKIPKSLPVPHPVRVGIWIDYLERLKSDLRKNLAEALEQLSPNLDSQDLEELVQAALAALPSSDERLSDWSRFRDDPDVWPLLEPALREEALRRVRRDVKGAREAYRLFGGILEEPPPPKPPKISEPRILEPPAQDGRRIAALRDALEVLLFDTDRELVDDRAETLKNDYANIGPASEAALDAMIAARSEVACEQFGASFSGKYMALGDAFRFLSEPAQNHLLECLEMYQGGKFKAQAALDIGYALKHKASRNAYSAALSRYVLGHAELRKQVAQRMVEDVRDLERKLKAMLIQKDGRA